MVKPLGCLVCEVTLWLRELGPGPAIRVDSHVIALVRFPALAHSQVSGQVVQGLPSASCQAPSQLRAQPALLVEGAWLPDRQLGQGQCGRRGPWLSRVCNAEPSSDLGVLAWGGHSLRSFTNFMARKWENFGKS